MESKSFFSAVSIPRYHKAFSSMIIVLLVSGILVSINPIEAEEIAVSEVDFPGQMAGSCSTSNGTLFVGDIDYHLYRSDDNGSSFESVSNFSAVAEPDIGLDGYMIMVYVDSRDYVFVSIPTTNTLFRSTDWGANFNEVLNTNGSRNDGFFLGFTEDNEGNLYTSMICNSIYPTLPQVLKSTDGGANWFTVLTARTIHFHTIAFNPYNNYLYACTAEDATPYTPLAFNDDAEAIYRSKDYGANWTKIMNHHSPGAFGNSSYLTFQFIGNDVYLGTDFGVAGAQPLNGIDHFYDDGTASVSPERVYTFPETDGQCPVVSSTNLNGTMIFSTSTEFNDGVTRVVASADGTNWGTLRSDESTTSLHHANILTQKPHGIVFASHSSSVSYKIFVGEDQPEPTTTPEPTPSPIPLPNGTIYALNMAMTASVGYSVYNEEVLARQIQACWIAEDGTLYAGSNQTLYKSPDEGQTWQPLLTFNGSTVLELSCVYVSGNNYLYAAPNTGAFTYELGLWRSIDGGLTWQKELSLPADCTIWGLDEDSNGNLFAGVYTGGSTSNARIYRSTDNGDSWVSVYFYPEARHVHDIAVDKTTNYIYASIGDLIGPWDISYIIRSTDGGNAWTEILAGLPQVVAIEAVPGARLFGTDAPTSGEIYISTDDVNFGSVLDTGLQSYGFWIRRDNINGNIFASFIGGEADNRNAGIYVSKDNGISWNLYKSFDVHAGYLGSPYGSNFVGGTMYYGVVLDGGLQNGTKIYTSNSASADSLPNILSSTAVDDGTESSVVNSTSFSTYNSNLQNNSLNFTSFGVGVLALGAFQMPIMVALKNPKRAQIKVTSHR